MEKEKKQHRDVAVLSQEYTQLCAKAGDLQYRISVFKKDLDMVNKAMTDLNHEAAASAAASKAAEESAPAQPEASSSAGSGTPLAEQ